jgi:putative ABC transport system substrate-binding protein
MPCASTVTSRGKISPSPIVGRKDRPSRFPTSLASSFAAMPTSSWLALAAKAATATIPIVMVGVGDPVGTGLVRSLARPGGNITGFVNLASDLSAKQVQLLVEVIPEIRRVGIVRNPSNPAVTLALREVENAIRVLGLESHTVDARLPQEFEGAFARLSAEGVKGVIVAPDASVIEHRSMIAALAQKTRLPTMFQRRENVAAGGLMSYGPDLPDQLRQAAFYVDRILKGTKPTDLPVQQATKIELVINLKTAKALGLTLPPHPAGPRRRGDRVSRRIERRDFITLLGSAAAAWPLAARAQQPAKLPTIGYLGSSTASAQNQWVAAFVHRLHDLGWIEGRTIAIQYRWAEGRTERFQEIAAEFAQLKVDVIVTSGTAPVLAAKQAATNVPIVFAVASDPVGNNLVSSLAHPGGNVTGLSIQQTDLAAKKLDLLREAVPDFRRLAILANVRSPASVLEKGEVEAAALTLNLEVVPVEIRRAEEIVPAFMTVKDRAEALYVCGDALITNNRIRIITLALGARLATMYPSREHVDVGGLMSYGPNFPDLHRRAADYVDKILRGSKPADIPVEQPTKFDFVINLTTAKVLGLEIPPTLLARADEVIE